MRPCAGLILNIFCKRLLISKNKFHFVQNGFNFIKRYPFTSIIQERNIIAGLNLFTLGTNVTIVLCVQRKI